MMRDEYEVPNLIAKLDMLWIEIKSLYKKLDKYVACKLKIQFGKKFDYSDGLIPAHIFGDMWAGNWLSLSDLVKPYPTEESLVLNKALKKQRYTVLKMFEIADDFCTSMGFPSCAESYNTSMGATIEKPTDGRSVSCETLAYDFCNGKDFRFQMCANVDFKDFVEIHGVMSHIQYYKQYAKQKYIELRNFVEPAFADAVGSAVVSSVTTWNHLEKVGIVEKIGETGQDNMNALMDKALLKLPMIPFAIAVDKWRWMVFSGKIQQEWNHEWWELREQYQKVTAPVFRRDKDFDPGAKLHVIEGSTYISYFISYIIEFQLYRNFCITAGKFDPVTKKVPLHHCDFYNPKKVGEKLKKGLSLGRSVHWTEVLKVMTGDSEYDASALVEYFRTLYDFMKKTNQEETDTSQHVKSFCFLPRHKKVLLVGLIRLAFVSLKFSINL